MGAAPCSSAKPRGGAACWPTLLTLALAYAVLEEGIITVSLFNPNYAGLRLLDRGFIPSLGIAAPWTVYVLTLHVAWSLGVPIALTEALFPERRSAPWLGWWGTGVTAALFVLGSVAVHRFQVAQFKFAASIAQTVGAALTAATLVAAAFLLVPRNAPPPLTGRKTPSPWLMAAASFVAGSTFALLKYLGPRLALPVALEVAGTLAVAAALFLFVARSARAVGWSDRHLFAVAAGGLLVYGWLGFVLVREIHGPGFEAIQTAWLAIAISVLGLAARRLSRVPPQPAPGP